ncbi:isochorismatase family protein [Roseovarius tibetensis]|uniref:isochorismatase family protein n=1 Tax=Roseovarius tibetensis TaxID=2685897 RepID=UPI003D7F4BF4
MPTLSPSTSHLLLIDFQARLMPVIHDADEITENARKLLLAARRLQVARSFTEQNPAKLGRTVPAVLPEPGEAVLAKMTFDACRTASVTDTLSGATDFIVLGCEAHVCVLQTVLGLLQAGHRVHVVADAVGARAPLNRDTALTRMDRAGAQIVTTEMVIFEWLGTATHPHLREIIKLIK